jgi:hypothetical protein
MVIYFLYTLHGVKKRRKAIKGVDRGVETLFDFFDFLNLNFFIKLLEKNYKTIQAFRIF